MINHKMGQERILYLIREIVRYPEGMRSIASLTVNAITALGWIGSGTS